MLSLGIVTLIFAGLVKASCFGGISLTVEMACPPAKVSKSISTGLELCDLLHKINKDGLSFRS